MSQLVEDKELHFDSDTFQKLREDADQVLQKLLANMAEKGSLEGRLTITVDVTLTEETVQNRDPNIDGYVRVVHTPKFQHKIGSLLQIKNEYKGNMNFDGMGMVLDTEKGEYVLRPITGREQMSIYDLEYPDNTVDAEVVECEVVEGGTLEGRKVAAIPGPSIDEEETDGEEPTESDGKSEDNPADEDDLSDEFGDDYDYQDPEDF